MVKWCANKHWKELQWLNAVLTNIENNYNGKMVKCCANKHWNELLW